MVLEITEELSQPDKICKKGSVNLTEKLER
jgi:hypothetical protein